MILSLTKIGNPVLRTKTRNVSPHQWNKKTFKKLLLDMVDTMHDAQGVGLAANQVDKDLRAFVMECRGNRRYPKVGSFPLQTYLNPRIVRYSKRKVDGWEGCLSIPGYRGTVPRSYEVELEAWTPQGQKVRKVFKDFEARVIQHEVDHLNGFFYMDRMKGLKHWLHLEEFNRHSQVKVADTKRTN